MFPLLTIFSADICLFTYRAQGPSIGACLQVLYDLRMRLWLEALLDHLMTRRYRAHDLSDPWLSTIVYEERQWTLFIKLAGNAGQL